MCVLIYALVLVFTETGDDADDPALREFAYLVCEYPRERMLELLAVAKVETDFDQDDVSSAGCVCILQQQCGKYGKPACGALRADVRLCVEETVEDLREWKRQCGESYLDAYNRGWSACRHGPWYEKHRQDKSRKWCRGDDCTRYGKRVREWQRRFDRWLDARRQERAWD